MSRWRICGDEGFTAFRKGALSNYAGQERRSKARLYKPFCAKVIGVNVAGRAFETEVVLENLSASGLYLRLAQQVETGTQLSVVMDLGEGEELASRVVAKGVVLRTQPQPDGTNGVAVILTRHRFV